MSDHGGNARQLTTSALAAVLFVVWVTPGRAEVGVVDIVFPNRWVGNIDKADFIEPSGICWHSRRGTLFVVGDQGGICEIETDGTLVKQKQIRDADFEGITHDPTTGRLYVAVETPESVIEIDPETFEVLRLFSIPRKYTGKTVMKKGGQGIEGIAFVPDDGHPQGGVFYITNQVFELDDDKDISAIFEVELPLRTDAGEPRILGYLAPGIIDLSGLYHDPESGHLFAVSDATNVLLEYSREHALVKAYAFPGDNQEGITVDDEGFIYIAQDSGGILKLEWLRGQ